MIEWCRSRYQRPDHPWHFAKYKDYTTVRPIHYINVAYDKYLHALHAQLEEIVARITEELIANTMHPLRLIRHLELCGDIEDF